MNRTRVYNVDKSKPCTGNKISEWAAVLAAAPLAFARVLPTATMSAAMGDVMGVLKRTQTLIGAIYAYPRVDLDGADACRARTTHAALLLLADDFISAVAAACLRPDCVELAKPIDVPNLHRMREVVAFSVPALAHVRHTVELAFESSHQPLKRAMVRGNGHDDAKRAMMRVVEGELASRLRMEPARFGIPDDWTAHAGVNEALKNAMPLWSESSAPWRLTGATVLLANVPQQAKDVAASSTRVGATLRWRERANRGNDDWVSVGDSVAVLVTSEAHSRRQFFDCSRTLGASGTTVAYFRVVGIASSDGGHPFSSVNPYGPADDEGCRVVRHRHFQYMPLVASARRAWVVHGCDECKPNENHRTAHSAANRWVILQRPRSG